MTDPSPPTQVNKRDGGVVPFDADRISRSLFAASESIGRGDPFLARELADSVVHFLAQECNGIPTTQEIAEVVVKVVRELGQPVLAAAFDEHGRRRPRRSAGETSSSPPASEASLASALADCARRWTLQTVFTRDLAAAQEAGLLILTGLQTPVELESCVLGPPVPLTHDVLTALEQARRFVGKQVALDGMEHLAATSNQSPGELAAAIALGLRLTGLEAVVNLDSASPPFWAGPIAEGPLFHPSSPDRTRLQELGDSLLTELLRESSGALRIDWHLSETSFSDGGHPRLLRVAQSALVGAPVAFVFDRPRRPIPLAEGLDRDHPATLLTVGLSLPALARQPGMLADPERFLTRLGSLVRLALSAAVQKRQFLHRHAPALTSNFLLDRARFVVAPVGLDEVIHHYSEWGVCNGGESLELGQQIVHRLRDTLRQDARRAQMAACLDGPAVFGLDAPPAGRDLVAGPTPWDRQASLRSQIRAGGVLHGAAEHGTLALFVPRDGSVGPEEFVEALRFAWRHTDVVRLRVMTAE